MDETQDQFASILTHQDGTAQRRVSQGRLTHSLLPRVSRLTSEAGPKWVRSASNLAVASAGVCKISRLLYQPPKVLTCAPLLASCKTPYADRSELSAVGIRPSHFEGNHSVAGILQQVDLRVLVLRTSHTTRRTQNASKRSNHSHQPGRHRRVYLPNHIR